MWGNIDKYILVKDDWHNYFDLKQKDRTKSVTLAAISRTWNRGISGFPYKSGKHSFNDQQIESDDVIRNFIEAMPYSVRTNRIVVEKLQYFLTMGQFFRCYPKDLITPALIDEVIDHFAHSNYDWDLPADLITLDWWRIIYKKGKYYNGMIRRANNFPDEIHQIIKAEKNASKDT